MERRVDHLETNVPVVLEAQTEALRGALENQTAALTNTLEKQTQVLELMAEDLGAIRQSLE